MISRQIVNRFNSKVNRELPRLRTLNKKDLLESGENIYVINSLDEIHEWIRKKSKKA